MLDATSPVPQMRESFTPVDPWMLTIEATINRNANHEARSYGGKVASRSGKRHRRRLDIREIGCARMHAY